eukprot:5298249-Pyramimonas_sp.AAC.3
MAQCQVFNVCALVEPVRRAHGASSLARVAQRACPARFHRQTVQVTRAGEMSKAVGALKRHQRPSVRCNGLIKGNAALNELYKTLKVEDFMTSPALSLRPDTKVETAIELLVTKGISGVPVTDDDGTVLGVISGFDIIALDNYGDSADADEPCDLFPKIGNCDTYDGDKNKMWSDFMELKEIAEFANSKTVGPIMHNTATIDRKASLNEASNMIIQRKLHRLCVLGEDGKLAGVLSRGDIMRATLKALQSQIMKSQELRSTDCL